MGLQTPSAFWVLSLAPSLGTLCSVQWMTVSLHFCIFQALAEPLRRLLYQASVSKHLLASTIVSGFGDCIWDGSPGGAVSRWPFLQSLCSTLCPCIYTWVLLWLSYLTQDDIFYINPLAFEFLEGIIFNSWVELHCVNAPHFCTISSVEVHSNSWLL